MSLAKLMMAALEPSVPVDTSGNFNCAGAGSNGERGLGPAGHIGNVSTFTQVGSLIKWEQVINGGAFSLGVRLDGTLWSWGYNTQGELGLGHTTTPIVAPIQIGVLTNWLGAKISCGNAHWSAIKVDGTLWGCGNNSQGMLGIGTTADVSVPTQVGSGTDWAQVAQGSTHALFIKTGGTLWSCGDNFSGTQGSGDTTGRSDPTQVGALTTWSKVGTCSNCSFGLTTAGTLFSWGYNTSGELGLGDRTNRSSPVQIGALTTWRGIHGNASFAFGTTTSGTLWSWGGGGNGQLAQGSTTSYSSPVQVGSLTDWLDIDQQTFSKENTLIRKTNGTLWGWGLNSSGQIGDGSTTYRSSPVQIGGRTDVALASSGILFGSWLDTAGIMYASGAGGAEGKLGNSTISVTYSSPVQIGNHSPYKKSGGNSSTQHIIGNDGKLWGMGISGFGEIGNGSTDNSFFPIRVGTKTNWADISACNDTTAAIDDDGKLFTTGEASNGKLGNGGSSNISSFTQIGSLTNWKQVSGTSESFSAVKTDGTLWSWGYNADGRLGDTTTTVRSSPVQLGSLTTWSKVACHNGGCQALKTDGTIWGWGTNAAGELGDGTTTARISPVQLGSATNWTDIACHVGGGLAVNANGQLFSWGYNAPDGELGLGDTTDRSSPSQVGSMTDWQYVFGNGDDSNLKATKTDSTFWVSGKNNDGRLGDGTTTSRSSPVQVAERVIYATGTTNAIFIITDND